MMRRLFLGFALMLCAGRNVSRVSAQTTQQGPRTYWLVVTGLSGEAEYAVTYAGWAKRIAAAARTRFGAAQVWWLAEKESDGVAATATRASIEARLKEISKQATSEDALFVVLIGHGATADGVSKFALPGPDLVPTDLALWLNGISARTTVINTASASGGWIAPLAAKGRVVVTATKSGVEQNETMFAQYFADALTLDAADTDKDDRVSVLEAFDFAKREVERAYAADKKMLTEHAQIDGNGDGKAVAVATPDSPDGAVAGLTHFGAAGSRTVAGTAAVPQPPALRALYAEKTRLERQLSDLRARKADTPEAEYQTQLEKLLTDIAVNGQAIRKLEGGK
ncbi:MAG: hypothetical protein ABIV28_09255 [Longimicrobiales bacterium]